MALAISRSVASVSGEQIARRIAADREFGKDHQLGPCLAKRAIRAENEGPVAAEVADCGIDLCEADFHENG